MDKKLIQEYGTDILCYRLRTARQKTRAQHEDFDKYLIQVEHERAKLWHRRNNLGWEPLLPPVQKGWKRFFVLREDVAKSKDGAFFENILQKINTYDWSHRKVFIQRRRKGGRKYYVTKPQKLREFYHWEFERQKFDEKERQYFDIIYHYRKAHESLIIKYVFREPWRFVLRVRPNIIDKVKARDHELEASLKNIFNYFERNNYGGRRDKLVYGKSWRHGGSGKHIPNPLKNKSFGRILNEMYHPGTAHA